MDLAVLHRAAFGWPRPVPDLGRSKSDGRYWRILPGRDSTDYLWRGDLPTLLPDRQATGTVEVVRRLPLVRLSYHHRRRALCHPAMGNQHVRAATEEG